MEDPYEVGAQRAAGNEVGGKTGGLYMPPWKLAQMMKDVTDKSSKEYQRLRWDALKKAINGLVNKVGPAACPTPLPVPLAVRERSDTSRRLDARSCCR